MNINVYYLKTKTALTSTSKNDRLPSRTSSHYEFGQRNIKIHNCLQQNIIPVSRSVSVPSQKYSRKSTATASGWNSNFLKNKQHFAATNDTASKTTNNSSIRVSRESSNFSKHEEKHVSYDQPKISKTPIPTPRKKIPSNKSTIPNYEYLQFSLRITEDIIRNDLYNPDEMQRVFNSHLEANRGRLDMTKMLEQIDHLCKELSIRTNVNTECATKSGELSLRNHSKILLDKIANNQYEISSDEIRNLSGPELQNLITGILDYEKHAKHFQSENNFSLSKKPDIESELLDLKQKNAATSSDSTKYFDIVTEDQKIFQLVEPESACTDLIPISFVKEKDQSEKPMCENKTILISSDEIETSVSISKHLENIQNKEITIINLEVTQLHNDLLEINKNLAEGFHNLKETLLTENPVKEDLTPKTAPNKCVTTVEENEVSIKKHEITQTPFSKEIARFLDKLPENLTITEDKEPAKEVVFENKDVLHFVGIAEKVEIENITQMYEQIKVYEPINTVELNDSNSNSETERSSENIIGIVERNTESNFISTVNNLILDEINDLFEPIESVHPEEIVPQTMMSDYYKYENKRNHHPEDKYITDKYKINRDENSRLYNKQPMASSQKSSDVSLSEGEILFSSKLRRKEHENVNLDILKVLKKYEYKTCDHNSINKYKLNKFDLNYKPSIQNVQFYHSPSTSSKNSRISVQRNRKESLLSDGEIKYSSSDSDDCKTDYSNNSSKV